MSQQGWCVVGLYDKKDNFIKCVTVNGPNARSIRRYVARVYPGMKADFGAVLYVNSYGAH